MRRLRADGYVSVWAPSHPLAHADGYVAEHRMIAYDAGLLVDKSDHVHHCNHDKTDNRLENLAVHSVQAHARLHADEGVIVNQYGVWPTGTGFYRRQAAWRARLGERTCEVCGRDISALRLDATVCGNNCRIKRWKRAHKTKQPAQD
jgi:hypothetical protein